MSSLQQAEFPFVSSPVAAAPLVPPKPPLVPPKQLFPPIPLDNAHLPVHQQIKVEDPGAKFCEDRFANLSVLGQAALLASIVVKMQDNLLPGEKGPLTLSSMRARLGYEADAEISSEVAQRFFLRFPPKQLELFLLHEIRNPDIREFVIGRFLDGLRRQLPAVAFTLAHLYSGGFYGLLTAREGRDGAHSSQLRAIGQILGHTPIAELTYYVNDPILSERLKGKFSGTAARKAAVLTNFACGLKEDKEGYVVPMTVGKRFDEIIFIDDEDKNLKEVLKCLIRGVCAQVFEKIGMRFRTPQMELVLNDRAEQLTDKEFQAHKVTRSGDLSFWISLVDNLLSGYTRQTGAYGNRETLIADLRAEGNWMPDVVKVYDGRTLERESSIETLRSIFEKNEPFVMGTKRSVVFDDIDRTILTVDARFYVVRKEDPLREPLMVFSQDDYAQEPREEVWCGKVSERFGIPSQELMVDWTHFRDQERIFVDHQLLFCDEEADEALGK